jgi:hypothetical protein
LILIGAWSFYLSKILNFKRVIHHDKIKNARRLGSDEAGRPEHQNKPILQALWPPSFPAFKRSFVLCDQVDAKIVFSPKIR